MWHSHTMYHKGGAPVDPCDITDIKDQLTRMESKLDSHLERNTTVEADLGWMKSHGKYLWVLLLGAIGKLAHITFLSK